MIEDKSLWDRLTTLNIIVGTIVCALGLYIGYLKYFEKTGWQAMEEREHYCVELHDKYYDNASRAKNLIKSIPISITPQTRKELGTLLQEQFNKNKGIFELYCNHNCQNIVDLGSGSLDPMININEIIQREK